MANTQELKASVLFQVKDHVCVVTGGGSGIGLMAAQALAANGARVYIIGRRREALEKAAKHHDPKRPDQGEIIPCGPYDVRKKMDLEKAVAEISSKETHVNLVVASAGIPGPKAEPDSSDAKELKQKLWNNESVEEWNATYEADVTAVYFTSVAFLPLIQAATAKHGAYSASIITISSMSGIIRNAQGHFSYNAAKGATIHLTKLMASEFQKTGIRVNSIAPGYFPSELTVKESGEDQKSELDPKKVQDKGHVPLGRPGLDQEMAQAVLFLAKNMYVSGQIIAVDGGVLNVEPQ